MRQKRGPKVAVQYDAGDPTFDIFAQAPQTAHFNLSKSIAKPFVKSDMKSYPPGIVPLRTLQFGSMPVVFENTKSFKLKTVQPIATRMNIETREEVIVRDAPTYNFNDGIRPGVRLLNSVP